MGQAVIDRKRYGKEELRQLQVLVGQGFTNREIAENLFVSVNTVKSVLNKICLKLGARSREEAIMLALKQREIELSEFVSLDEIAGCLAHLKPESLAKIARLLAQRLEQKRLRTAG